MGDEIDSKVVTTIDEYATPQRQKRRHEGFDDTRNIDELKQRSTEKLRQAWESIYHKFEDSHLDTQDDIYLGSRSVKGDRMRVIVDRGHLRSISKKKLEFGCFHIDEAEVIGCEEVKEEDMLACSSPQTPTATLAQSNRIDASDLSDFLKAEAQRKQLNPSDSEEEEKPVVVKLSISAKRTIKSQPTSACPGAGKCMKSLCFLCGGTGHKIDTSTDD
jgi:hypothetical protein